MTRQEKINNIHFVNATLKDLDKKEGLAKNLNLTHGIVKAMQEYVLQNEELLQEKRTYL